MTKSLASLKKKMLTVREVIGAILAIWHICHIFSIDVI